MRAYYNEFDPYAAAWLRNLIAAGHIADGDVDERSIVDVQPSDLAGYDQAHFFAGIGGWSLALRLAGWADDRPAWTGSCPCQPFSAAGKRKGVEDHRHLWPELRRLIAKCNPPVIFGEQVASADGRDWLAGVRADLEGMGYAVGAADLCASGAGAPHIRQRLWWGAERDCERAEGERSRAADTGSERRQQVGGGAPRDEGEDGRQPDADHVASGDGEDGSRRLADAEHDGRREHGRRLDQAAGSGEGAARERERLRADPADGSATGGMGDADDAGSQGRDQLRHGAGEWAPWEASWSGGLEHPEGDGRVGRWPEPSGRGAAGGCGDGFWSDFDLLPCTDGKARRVEPGTFPLAHGVSNRVGRLRAYGNAIVPQVAAEFIRAWLDCRP